MSILYAKHIEPSKTGIEAKLSHDFQLHIDFLEDWLVRVSIIPQEGLTIDRTWMIAPETSPPLKGRNKQSLQHFSCPKTELTDNTVSSGNCRIKIDMSPLRLIVEQQIDNQWQVLSCDRKNGAYQWLEKRSSFRHFQSIDRGDKHFGLGDKSGLLDRTRRRFKCLQTDALGYDAALSDPLYKHAPFFISHQQDKPAYGVLYDTFSEISFDFASEHSNYFKPFRHVDSQEKGLVYYLIIGPEINDVVPRLHQLTGMPAMPPRWSMGFAFSGMAHTDSPTAQETILDFAKTMRDKKLPISALHLGSGYTLKDNGCRYVFNWNLDKFPEREAFFKTIKSLGYYTCANVKPVLLDDHDSFAEAKKAGWFVSRKNGSPAIERFWDGAGAQLDFTHQGAIDFWHEGITSQVLDAGFDSVWNDNNEAELWDETATVDGYGTTLEAISVRPIHALQMLRTSYHAMLQKTPDKRPYTISRAGPIGTSRYGETWSGDNETSWQSLKWNLRQGLSMSLSGFPVVGHDIGGFSGPSPTPELLVRWFQMMALHPRAVMNSWKPDEVLNTNLPYMYEEATELVKQSLTLRYRFLPYLYALTWQSHKTGHPIIRPLFYDYPDVDCFSDQDAFLLGSDVLVAPATDENQQEHLVYLPATSDGWIDFYTHETLSGSQWIKYPAELGLLPIFIRLGSMIPLAKHWDETSPHNAQTIELMIYPSNDKGNHRFTLLLDEGNTTTPEKNQLTVFMQWDKEDVAVSLNGPSNLSIDINCPTLGARKLNKTN